MRLCFVSKNVNYLTLGMGPKYCDEYVSLSVCSHSSKTTQPNFTKFLKCVAYGRGSVLLWQCSDTLYTSGFVDDVMISHRDPMMMLLVYF